jgi:ketosteroid isomerase-like protein
LLTYEARFWPPRSATTRAKLPRPVVGAESIAAVFTRSPHFKTMMWTVEHCLVDGDYVTVHTRMQGKLGNGNEYDNWHLWLFCFEDERITDAWEYADTAYAFELMKV